MIVTRREFDDALDRVRAEVRVPAHGIFGPESITWRVSRDPIVFLGAGRAALLQLAHPYVAHAVEQHSETRRDPVGRFNRTFLHVYGMIFGDLDDALGSARRVRAIHERVNGPIDEDVARFARGHRYHANEAGALRWVFATLIETAVMCHELGFGPLSPHEKRRYYEESKRFAWLFGIPDDVLPESWDAFCRYCAGMYAGDELGVGRPGREIAGFLLSARHPALGPLVRWYRTLTAGMLPPRLREGYGLPFSRADALVYEASLKALGTGWPHIPERLRMRPEYVEAMHRLEGRPRPARFSRAFEQLVLRAMRPRAAD